MTTYVLSSPHGTRELNYADLTFEIGDAHMVEALRVLETEAEYRIYETQQIVRIKRDDPPEEPPAKAPEDGVVIKNEDGATCFMVPVTVTISINALVTAYGETPDEAVAAIEYLGSDGAIDRLPKGSNASINIDHRSILRAIDKAFRQAEGQWQEAGWKIEITGEPRLPPKELARKWEAEAGIMAYMQEIGAREALFR